jgi:hypothetical protein
MRNDQVALGRPAVRHPPSLSAMSIDVTCLQRSDVDGQSGGDRGALGMKQYPSDPSGAPQTTHGSRHCTGCARSYSRSASTQRGSLSGARITGILSWMSATNSFTSVVMIANVRTHSPEAGSFQFSQMPARPNDAPSFTAIA